MDKKRVVCSFDYTNDKYYYILTAWNDNQDIDFEIIDCTPSEIQSESVSTIKRVLSEKIGEAEYMVAIIGKHSNEQHRDHDSIGYRNWQSYEIEKNYEKGNSLVVVLLDASYDIPYACYLKNAEWVTGFEREKIKSALDKLSQQ